ncbi:hypothetical protein BH11MYX1_BH11MYX1_07200 [soil metagenome]
MKLTKRTPQRGSAMLVTMIIIASLLAGAAVLVSMQLASNRSSDLTRSGMAATDCAESGLNVARSYVVANISNWNAALATCGSGATYPCAEPSWLSQGAGVNHDSQGTGSNSDFVLYLKDNDDELSPAPNDPTHDSDLRVFVVSRCTKYTDTVKEVEELIEYTGGGNNYRAQQGLGRLGGGNNN